MRPEPRLHGRVAIQQRVLPAYRAPFFELLAQICEDGVSIYAGTALPREQIRQADSLEIADFTTGRNIHFLDPSSRFFLCWQRGLLKWLEAADPQALVIEANPRYLSSRRAVQWMHTRGRPVLGWGLGAPPITGFLASLREGERRTFVNNLDGMVAYSRRGADEYQRLGIPEERVFTAPNAAAAAPQQAPPARSDVLSNGGRVLFVGRLQERKRLDLLFRACASLPEGVQPEVIVVGDGPARQEFEQAAQAEYPRVTFTGDQRGQQLAELFRRADLFVLPGTGGLAVQQALGYGLPVIVAQGDGTQADMVRPENGWLVPPGDLAALTQALHEALSNPTRLRAKGAASYQIASQEVNLEVMAAAFAQAIQGIQELGMRSR